MNKFNDYYKTATGEDRAFVDLSHLEVLWFNTGTLCNIECTHCYIESSPHNDRLSYLNLKEVTAFFEEIKIEGLSVRQIGFTGGEPFMNPDFLSMIKEALKRRFEVLVLTNAMQPMMRPKICADLIKLKQNYDTDNLIMRVSLDHYDQKYHDAERGEGSWKRTMMGLKWLSQSGFRIHIAGRQFSHEDKNTLYKNYHILLEQYGIALDQKDPEALVVFPEMDARADIPEITTQCWKVLEVDPETMMCASSRMVVKRKGDMHPHVVSCTLLPYQEEFNLGATLKQAHKRVWLNHPHCARFCVLGGGSCSG